MSITFCIYEPSDHVVLCRQIYGGVGIGVAVAAALSILALSNVSAPQFLLHFLRPSQRDSITLVSRSA